MRVLVSEVTLYRLAFGVWVVGVLSRGLGFGGWGLGVGGLGFRVQGLGLRVYGLGCRAEG